MKYKGLIFDLDGTLVDTLADLTDAINHGLTELGFESKSADQCRMMIGDGTQKFVERALGKGNEHLGGDLIRIMREYYGEHCLEKSRVYNGMNQAVATLYDRGGKLGVVTNKDARFAEIIVKHFFGDKAFGFIFGADGKTPIKPDPTGALKTAEFFGLDAGDFLFAGDSDVDIYTADNAGMTSVGVTWGFRDREILEAAGADFIIDKPGEILDLTA